MGEGTHRADKVLVRLAVITQGAFDTFAISSHPSLLVQLHKCLTPRIKQGDKWDKVYPL